MTPGRELREINAMSNSGLCIVLTTLGHELRPLNSMNSSGLWMI